MHPPCRALWKSTPASQRRTTSRKVAASPGTSFSPSLLTDPRSVVSQDQLWDYFSFPQVLIFLFIIIIYLFSVLVIVMDKGFLALMRQVSIRWLTHTSLASV